MRVTTAIVLDLDVEVPDAQGCTATTLAAMGAVEDWERLSRDLLTAMQADSNHLAFVMSAAQLAGYAVERLPGSRVDVWPIAARGKLGLGDADYLVDVRTVDPEAKS